MFSKSLFKNNFVVKKSFLSIPSFRFMSGGHDHHDTTFEPPFHRLPLQSKPVSSLMNKRNKETIISCLTRLLTFHS